jgi:hypothetical protein
MTLPQPARAELREKIAENVERAMTNGALCYDAADNPGRWKRSVETFTDDILALTDAAYADFQGAELRDGE